MSEVRSDGDNPQADFDLRIVRSLATYVDDKHGRDILEQVARAGGCGARDLLTGSRWVAAEQIHAILGRIFELLGKDEEAFLQAATYRIRDSYGPIRFALMAASPTTVVMLACKTIHLVAKNCRYEVQKTGRASFISRFYSSAPEKEHRLLCLLRRANGIGLPTIWGLPPARITENACISRGDPYCEYDVKLAEYRGWASTTGAGALAGGVLGTCLALAGWGGVIAWLTLPLLGGLLGHVFRLRNRLRINQDFLEEQRTAIEDLAKEDAQVRQELYTLTQRQAAWSRMLEEQVADRTRLLEDMVGKLRQIQHQSLTTVRGYSHDLRSPLSVVMSLSYMIEHYDSLDPEDRAQFLAEHEHAARMIERITQELWNLAESRQAMELRPERLDVEELPDMLRRRLKALVFGRDIRVSVFRTREAPDGIEIDPLVFDRIVDNLLGNAAKYTVRGSIVVEISGVPDHLVLKISDTGRGISEQEISRIFSPGGSDPAKRAAGSHGHGLSVTVRLLGQIGGRLEIMSKPEVGTTFWAYLPLAMRTGSAEAPATGASEQEADEISKVVRIRRLFEER